MAGSLRLTDLPSDATLNVSSYLLGVPSDLKLKRNKTVKQIQTKQKPVYGNVHCYANFDGSVFWKHHFMKCETKMSSMSDGLEIILKLKT